MSIPQKIIISVILIGFGALCNSVLNNYNSNIFFLYSENPNYIAKYSLNVDKDKSYLINFYADNNFVCNLEIDSIQVKSIEYITPNETLEIIFKAPVSGVLEITDDLSYLIYCSVIVYPTLPNFILVACYILYIPLYIIGIFMIFSIFPKIKEKNPKFQLDSNVASFKRY